MPRLTGVTVTNSRSSSPSSSATIGTASSASSSSPFHVAVTATGMPRSNRNSVSGRLNLLPSSSRLPRFLTRAMHQDTLQSDCGADLSLQQPSGLQDWLNGIVTQRQAAQVTSRLAADVEHLTRQKREWYARQTQDLVSRIFALEGRARRAGGSLRSFLYVSQLSLHVLVEVSSYI